MLFRFSGNRGVRYYSSAMSSSPLSARQPKFEGPRKSAAVSRLVTSKDSTEALGPSWFVSQIHPLGSLVKRIKWIEADNAKVASIPVGSVLQASLRCSNSNPFGD